MNDLSSSLVEKVENMCSQIKKLQSTMSDIGRRLDEDRKDNRQNLSMAMHKFHSVKATMDILVQKLNVDPEKEKLKMWLTNKVKLPQYFDMFVQNGIEDLTMA